MASTTLQNHIHSMEVVIVNLTSPAALNPYGGINAMIHTIGFTIVIHVTMNIQSFALSGSMPPKYVIG